MQSVSKQAFIFSSFQEKKGAVDDDAPSPPADGVVQADADAETDSGADNVTIFAFKVSQIQSEMHHALLIRVSAVCEFLCMLDLES